MGEGGGVMTGGPVTVVHKAMCPNKAIIHRKQEPALKKYSWRSTSSTMLHAELSL